MNAPDPLHHAVGSGIRYNRINNAEVLPGVMTAASWSFWDEAVERAFRRALFDLGIHGRAGLAAPADPAHRLRAVFHGRVATNMSHHQAVGADMPGFMRTAFMVHLFADETGAAAGPRRMPAWLWRMPWLVLRLPARVHAGHHAAKLWWRAATAQAPRGLAADIDALREAVAAFERAMTVNITTSLLSSVPVQQIVAAAKAAGREATAPAVISGYGTQEAVMAQRLTAVAGGGETLEAFLADFGFHGQAEGQLHRASWREDPEQVRARAAALGKSAPAGRTPEAVRDAQQQAEQALLAATSRRLQLRFHLWLARRFAPLRELTKAWYLMTIDAGRAALRRIGQSAVAADRLDTRDDVFHLTLPEIFAAAPQSWRAIVRARRAQFDARQALDIPEHFSGVPEALTTAPAPAAGGGVRVLTGLGVSAGVAEGLARVVREVDGVDELQDGEVLVCRSTDPSWAPAFMIASAVVIDIGSLLSHGAIVARELGLPCVVNAGGASGVIRTGDRVRVDGGRGSVEIIEELGGMCHPPQTPRHQLDEAQ